MRGLEEEILGMMRLQKRLVENHGNERYVSLAVKLYENHVAEMKNRGVEKYALHFQGWLDWYQSEFKYVKKEAGSR